MADNTSRYINLGILAAIGVGIYLIVKEFGNSGSSSESTATTAEIQADLASASSQEPPNYSSTQYSNWADEIYAAAATIAASSDSATVLGILDQIWNLADMYSLVAAFGTRKACPWWSGVTLDTFGCQQVGLNAFISQGFTSDMIAQFNQQLGYNNVSYSF